MVRTLPLLVLAASLAGPLSSGSVAASTAEPTAAAGEDDDLIPEDAWVKLELTHAGKTRKHPGYLANADEEMVLTLGQGDAAQEVSILLTEADGKWTAKINYKVGDTVVVTAEQKIRTKTWIDFKSEDGKSKVRLHVDPDSSGGEDIDVGKGDKPLDGLE